MLYSAATFVVAFTRRRAHEETRTIPQSIRPSVLSLLCQAGLVGGYVLASGSSEELAKADPSGALVAIFDFVESHRELAISFTAVLWSVESLAIGASVYERVIVRRVIREAEAAEAAALEAVARRAYEPVSASAWNSRLAEKYGVDVRAMDADVDVDQELGRPLLPRDDDDS
jgi:hypothetical protein